MPTQPERSYFVVFNPAARSGRAHHHRPEIQTAFDRLPGTVKIVDTAGRGDARRMAAEAARENDVIVAVGGDGTVHEVAAGIMQSKSHAALAVIPAGTGNDFARMIGMPTDARTAVAEMSTARCENVDAGRVTWSDDQGDDSSFFINAVGIGFDGYAASLAPRFKHLPFRSGYLVTILRALLSWKPSMATISEVTETARKDYRGTLFMLTIGNARDSGGGFTINPLASITDHQLDACLVTGISFIRALRLLPLAARGEHLRFDEVKYWQTTGTTVETGKPVPVHADGEILTLTARRVRIEIEPSALTVLVPRKLRLL